MININLLYEDVYSEYLEESAERLMKEALEAQEKTVQGLVAFKEFMDLELNESLNEDETSALNTINGMATALAALFNSGVESGKKISDIENDKKYMYNALPTEVKVKSFSTLKFPDNIVFVISQIIKWLKNVVKKFVESATNFIRRVVGLKSVENEITEDDLALKLRTAQMVEKNRMNTIDANIKGLHLNGVPEKDAVEIVNKFKGFMNESSYFLNEDGGMAVGEIIETGREETNPDRTENKKPNKNNNNNNNGTFYYKDNNKYDNKKDKKDVNYDNNDNIYKNITVQSIDVSQDLLHLKEALSHFFTLFDNSIGSNDELLFGTGDLELMLKLLQTTAKDITTGNEQLYAINGKLTTSDVVSAERLRDTLIRTKVNTDNLRNAYRETQDIINRTLHIINSKQSLAATAPGVSMNWRLLSSSTYKQLSDILKVIKKREKEAVKLEKGLAKMERNYEALVKNLEKLKGAYLTLPANVTFTSVMQKRVTDLYDAAKYMTQTVTLRFLTLGLYIRQVQEIKTLISNLNSINKPNKNFRLF